jgi:hypothetical protein
MACNSFAFHLFFFPGSQIYAISEPSPRGLRIVFMIFLSSFYFGNGEKMRRRSGEKLHYFLVVTAPSSMKFRIKKQVVVPA